ncbi:MAG: LuxR C-terminal-related transcriptional regulator [Phycisphaerales bacterium]
MNTEPCRSIRPDDFEILEQIPGIVGVARNEELRMFWCTKAFYRLVGYIESSQDMMGKALDEIVPKSAAKERTDVFRQVIDENIVVSNIQFSDDIRMMTTIFPLDPDAFGHRGVLAVIKDAPVDIRLGIDRELPVLSNPCLAQLNALTPTELIVLWHLATGISTNEIAAHLCRSPKTIENHINSIHTKLGTHLRSELVRYACERGIQSFSIDQWEKIVAGAKIVNQETKA